MLKRVVLAARIRKLLAAGGQGGIRLGAILGLLAYPGLILLWLASGIALVAVGIAHTAVSAIVIGGFLTVLAIAFTAKALGASCLQMSQATTLHRTETPHLFDAVDAIAHTLRIRPPARIEIDEEENACVYAEPSGLVGLRPVLRVGLPLMMAMTPEEFRSVLAHECGHLKRNDHIFGRILHRIEMAWIAGHDGRDAGSKMPFYIKFIYKLLEPTVRPLIFAESRLAEEHADSVSSKLFPGAGSAKVRAGLLVSYGRSLTEQWIAQYCAQRPEPPPRYTRARLEQIRARWSEEGAAKELQCLLHWPDNLFAAHPTLSRVLELAGESPDAVGTQPPPEISASAAAYFLHPSMERIEEELDTERRILGEQYWKHHHAVTSNARRLLSGEPPAADDAEGQLDRARALLTMARKEEALPCFRHALRLQPDNVDAVVAYVETQVRTGQPEAPQAVEALQANYPHRAWAAMEGMIEYYARAARADEAAETINHLLDFQDRWEAVVNERQFLAKNAPIKPHALNPKQFAHLKSVLLQQADVIEARVAQRVLSDFENAPILVILLRYGGATSGSTPLQLQRNQEIANLIPPFVGESFVWNQKSAPALWKKARSFDNSLLFSRGRA